MTAAIPGLYELGKRLAGISRWVDSGTASPDREAKAWGRLAKIGEEFGEVVAAYIGATGQNPRKGVTHTMEDVQRELLDVAVTALVAWEHLDANGGTSTYALADHIDTILCRIT